MNLRMMALIVLAIVVTLASYGSATGETSAAWQLTFFVLMAMSMACLVADRQRPI